MVLLRNGLKILLTAMSRGQNVFEQHKANSGSLAWFMEFDLSNAQALVKWLETMEELARWFSESDWRLKTSKCSLDDMLGRLSRVAPESFVSNNA